MPDLVRSVGADAPIDRSESSDQWGINMSHDGECDRFVARDAVDGIPDLRDLSDRDIETKFESINIRPHDSVSTLSSESIFKILKECTTRQSLSHLSRPICILLSHPAYASVRSQQILAFVTIISAESVAIGLRQGFVDFSLAALEEIFESAENARKTAVLEGNGEDQAPSTAANSRPGSEITLLKHLDLLSKVIDSNADILHLDDVPQLMTLLSLLLGRTTGQSIMRRLLDVLTKCACNTSLPPDNLDELLHTLCQISADEEGKNHRAASQILNCFLRGAFRLECFQSLTRHICLSPSISLWVRSTALRAIAENVPSLKAADIHHEVSAGIIKTLCEGLLDAVGPVGGVPCLAEPLTDIAKSCHTIVSEAMFSELLCLIKRLANLDGPFADSAKAVDPHFVAALVELFLKSFQRAGHGAKILFDMLVAIARGAESIDARLYSMKLLMRLRCDEDFGISVVKDPDEQGLSDILRREILSVATARVSPSPSSQQPAPNPSTTSSKDTRRKTLTPNRNRSQSRSRPLSTKGVLRSTGPCHWLYDESKRRLPSEPPQGSSGHLYASVGLDKAKSRPVIALDAWLQVTIEQLRSGSDWELLSYVMVHLPSQLGNCSLFRSCERQIAELHDLLNEFLAENLFSEPPLDSGVKRGDVALCLYHSLAMLLAYQDSVGVRQWKRVVSTFRAGVEKWDAVGRFCIHFLSVCCYEIPNIILNQISLIIEMMQKRTTQSDLAMDILDFLACLSRTPEAYDRHDFLLHQKIFGICIRYLQHSREHRNKHNLGDRTSTYSVGQRTSGSSNEGFRRAHLEGQDQFQRILHEFIFTTAYQVMIFWFLAIDIHDRPRHSAWITQELTWKNEHGMEELEQQSLVILDMMHRTTYTNLGETHPAPQFLEQGRTIYRRTWIVGLSIITLEVLVNQTALRPEFGQVTKRQSSGTTHAVYYHNTEDIPAHQAQGCADTTESLGDAFALYPNHLMLQLNSSISPTPASLQPIPLPDNDEFTNRVLRIFDATETVDGHKAAILFVGEGQSTELAILRNDQGNEAFESFIRQLGFKVGLKNAKFNTQGLDRGEEEADGAYTYAWRDRVTEIVFHLPTLMPSSCSSDDTCDRKKAHIGNDHVKIIFNCSGAPFDTRIFASDFNSINIIITPEATSRSGKTRAKPGSSTAQKSVDSKIEPSATDRYGYYLVHTISTKPLPEITPAASPQVISACGLPGFVRQLALTASVFCQIWACGDGEYTSSWLFRLQQILKLRERHAAANASSNVGYPQAADAGPSPYAEGETWTGMVAYGGMAEQSKLTSSLDFTRWTK